MTLTLVGSGPMRPCSVTWPRCRTCSPPPGPTGMTSASSTTRSANGSVHTSSFSPGRDGTNISDAFLCCRFRGTKRTVNLDRYAIIYLSVSSIYLLEIERLFSCFQSLAPQKFPTPQSNRSPPVGRWAGYERSLGDHPPANASSDCHLSPPACLSRSAPA